MTRSKVEDAINAFVTYVKATLPGNITTANVGMTIAAPALKKIEKSVRMDAQYLPSAMINLESVEHEESGQLARRQTLLVNLIILAAHGTAATLDAYIDRYHDAALDLATSTGYIPGTGYVLTVVASDKGIEADGTRGYVVVQFTVKSEELY